MTFSISTMASSDLFFDLSRATAKSATIRKYARPWTMALASSVRLPCLSRSNAAFAYVPFRTLSMCLAMRRVVLLSLLRIVLAASTRLMRSTRDSSFGRRSSASTVTLNLPFRLWTLAWVLLLVELLVTGLDRLLPPCSLPTSWFFTRRMSLRFSDGVSNLVSTCLGVTSTMSWALAFLILALRTSTVACNLSRATLTVPRTVPLVTSLP